MEFDPQDWIIQNRNQGLCLCGEDILKKAIETFLIQELIRIFN